MGNYDLEFCFKGDRNYVHGTDIYNKIINLFKNSIAQKFDLSFHSISTKNIKLSDKIPDDKKSIKFVCRYINKLNNKITIYGIESENKIKCRYKYPENDICLLSKINTNDKEITLIKNTSYTFIENCVALNKHLLTNLFCDTNKKWYFTRLQLEKLPNNIIYPLRLTLKANFNFKLTKTEIFIGNYPIGFIYFSLI